MKKAYLEQNTNRLLGWYDTDIHSVIPEPNIEVTDNQWQEALDLGANAYKNGSFIVKDFRTAEEIAEADKQAQIGQAKRYLEETDYKVLPDYDGNTDGVLEVRAEARALIRGLEG